MNGVFYKAEDLIGNTPLLELKNVEKEYGLKAKIFAKEHISIRKRNYDNSTSFYTEYFGSNPKLLVDCIKKYHKHNGSHSKEEHYLDELLK